MITKEELCKEIESMYPDFGVCGIDFDVEYDEEAKAWAVDLHHDDQHLKTFLEVSEVNQCLEGKKCMPLALQIAQLKSNFNKYIHEHALKKDH